MPEEIATDKSEARYEDGRLKISLPRKVKAKKAIAKHIADK